MDYYTILRACSDYSVLLPLITGAIFFRKGSKLTKTLFVIAGWVAMVEVALDYTNTQNNLWVSHVSVPVQLGLFILLYYYHAQEEVKKFYLWLIPVSLTLMLGSTILLEGFTSWNTHGEVLESIILVLLAILSFHSMLNNPDKISLTKNAVFILSVGVIIYFSAIATASSLFNIALKESYETARICLMVVYGANIFFHPVQAYVIWLDAK